MACPYTHAPQALNSLFALTVPVLSTFSHPPFLMFNTKGKNGAVHFLLLSFLSQYAPGSKEKSKEG